MNEQVERIRKLDFNVYRVHDLRRFTATPDDSFITQYHLQKDVDSHTLCGYKTDVNKVNGKWAYTSESYFADTPFERDTMCFRCLRVWALKNGLEFPRKWMVTRLENKETRKVLKRKDVKNDE